MSTLKRIVILSLICVLIPVLALLVRAEVDAAAACRQAGLEELNGQMHDAMYHYARCAEWNTLMTDESDAAENALIRLALAAEHDDKLANALVAWRYLRSAWLATDHIFRLDKQTLLRANVEIARLTAQLQFRSGSPTVGNRTIEQLQDDHLRLLNRRNGPGPWGGGIIFVLFLTWVGTVFWTIWFGVSRDGQLIKKTSIRGGLMIAISFTLFCFSLSYF